MSLKRGHIVDNRFRVERALGQGGFGTVYEVTDKKFGVRRALKVFAGGSGADAKARSRFVREAKAAASVSSDHVVKIIDYGTEEGESLWICMELLEGATLEDFIRREGPLSPQLVRHFVLQLGHALGAAHSQGLLHLDLKPANIFLATTQRVGDLPELKVLDFGLAHTFRSGRSYARMTTAAGTIAWMPPEQHDPKSALRASTDVYPLGLIAFWMLTGHHYWLTLEDGAGEFALMQEITKGCVVSAGRRAAALGFKGVLPTGFDAWFARCLSPDPAARWADAVEATQGLAAMLQGVDRAPKQREHIERTIEAAAPLPPAGFTVPFAASVRPGAPSSPDSPRRNHEQCSQCGRPITTWNRDIFSRLCPECAEGAHSAAFASIMGSGEPVAKAAAALASLITFGVVIFLGTDETFQNWSDNSEWTRDIPYTVKLMLCLCCWVGLWWLVTFAIVRFHRKLRSLIAVSLH